MRSGLVEILHMFFNHPIEMALTQDQHVSKALTPHATQESFADGIGVWRAIGRFQNFNFARRGHLGESLTMFAIAISNQETRMLAESCGLS